MVAALRRGEISGSFGRTIPEFEEAFAEYCGCHFGVAVTRWHDGSTSSGRSCRVSTPGDEVLISASTNIATALAVVHNGAIPVPVDSEDVTWNLDLDLIESLSSRLAPGQLSPSIFMGIR